MRVAIDATPLSVPAGGVRRYTHELTCALRNAFPNDEFTLISDQPFDSNRPSSPGPIGRRWWTLGVQREMSRVRSEIFHGTDFAVPYFPVRPSVMTLHDLSPWRRDLPGRYSARVRRRTPLLLRLGVATMVIAPTEAVKSEAVERFGLAPDRVAVVPEGATPRSAAPCRYPKPYFLFVGSDEPRKNLGTVLDAWRAVRERADLIVVGTRGNRPDEPGLMWLAGISDEELAGLYQSAAALVYPSLYEGFGLPVIEAMSAGAPVIASRDAALREVAGGAALHVEATDTAAWAAAMTAMLDASNARPWAEAGRRRAAAFTWERCARETREVYAEAIRRFRN